MHIQNVKYLHGVYQEDAVIRDAIYLDHVLAIMLGQIGILTCTIHQLTSSKSTFFKHHTIMNGLAINLIETSYKANLIRGTIFGKHTQL